MESCKLYTQHSHCLVFKVTCSTAQSWSDSNLPEQFWAWCSYLQFPECYWTYPQFRINFGEPSYNFRGRKTETQKGLKTHIYFHKSGENWEKLKSFGTGEMAQCLKALAALQRAQFGFPGPTWWSTAAEAPVPRDLSLLLALVGTACRCYTYIHAGKCPYNMK